MNKTLKESRQTFIDQKIHTVAQRINDYLSSRHKILQDYANFPIITQRVMQPKSQISNVADFLDERLILGKKYPLTLLDFSKKNIYSTRVKSPTSTILLNQNKDNKIKISLDKNQQLETWHLYAEIFYNQLTEGFLVLDISMYDMVKQLELEKLGEHHQLQLEQDNKVIFTIGSLIDEEVTRVQLPNLKLTLAYRTNTTTLNALRTELLQQIIISFLLLWACTTIAVHSLAHKHFVKPLEKLQEFASNVANNEYCDLNDKKFKILEIAELKKNFKDMVDKILLREMSLKRAKIKQEQLNKNLTHQQQMLVQSEKMASVGQLAAGVAHEINNPTGFVMGNLEVLKEYKMSIQTYQVATSNLQQAIASNDKEKIQKQLASVSALQQKLDIDYIMTDMDDLIADSINGTERIRDIVQDLKSFSRVDDTNKCETDLNEDVIKTALRLVWNEMKYKCTLEKRLQPLPLLFCYPSELSQVIMNLLINACYACEDSNKNKGFSEIIIASYYDNNTIFITVTDNGCGISEAEQIKMFDPFFTTKPIGKGTGLGLSISHSIIKKHNGNIQVSSQVGKGTTFTISLPLTSSEKSIDTVDPFLGIKTY